RLLGIEQRAEVLRDAFGVPHVYAQNAHDLFYLQGYVTAQDRLFQMDLYRRAGEGRLAEVLGEPGLEADRSMRTLGFARVAAQELLVLRPDGRAALDAYAEGVNKFLEQHGESLPLEFGLVGLELLGPRGRANGHGKTAPRRRPAPRGAQPGDLVRDRARGGRLQGRRFFAPGYARRRDRAQRPDRLEPHLRVRRHPGSLRRANRSDRSTAL